MKSVLHGRRRIRARRGTVGERRGGPRGLDLARTPRARPLVCDSASDSAAFAKFAGNGVGRGDWAPRLLVRRG